MSDGYRLLSKSTGFLSCAVIASMILFNRTVTKWSFWGSHKVELV